MRTLIVTNIVSLDGYFAGPGGDVMAMPMDHAFDESNLEHMRHADTLLLGATTYRDFLGFWPDALDMPDITGASAEIARIYRDGIDKVVVSDSLTEEGTGPWRTSTRIVRRAAARAAVAEMKQDDGGDILVFGSATLWNDLLAAGLVDELHLMIAPIALGAGVPAFRGATASGLVLTDVRRWEGSPNVLLQYCA